ncbi:MAG: hypothetical protein WC285_01725 [Candidatus Gracilibacteria bacterium]|jgi:hypothetical protein
METALVTAQTFNIFLEDFKKFQEEFREFKNDVHRRFEQADKRMDRIEYQQLEDRKMLMDVWQSREKVTVNFPKGFVGINAFISGVISATVAFFIK